MAINFANKIERDRDRAKVMEDWAMNVLKRWAEEIKAQDMKNASKLIESLHKRVYNASGGDQTKIVFTLYSFGRFADLGVGRGEKYSRDKHNPIFRSGQKYPETAGYKWQVKPWFLPVFKQRVYSLAAILERKYFEYGGLMFFQNIKPEKFLNPNS